MKISSRLVLTTVSSTPLFHQEMVGTGKLLTWQKIATESLRRVSRGEVILFPTSVGITTKQKMDIGTPLNHGTADQSSIDYIISE